ncbi:AAA family ATPase [Nocardia sp. NPDC052566]|uniref:AAA family ATPase n=1 Tax=Nocardia sp. NPDC052566 TaxID=3364330 RepID=UPI0037C75D84
MTDDPVLTEMLAALGHSPDVLALRVHVIELLADRGRHAEALAQCATALTQDPQHARTLELLQQCTIALAGAATPTNAAPPPAESIARTTESTGRSTASEQVPTATDRSGRLSDAANQPVPHVDSEHHPGVDGSDPELGETYDWAAAEDQVGDIIAPAFINDGPAEFVTDGDVGVLERPTVSLADVGGMADVKRQLELTLLGPMRNPELAKAFGTSARGGLLLYGPPGCGKTFLASAVAGELGANFYPIEIADILDIYHGSGERNVHEVFELARRNAPCVLFLDEVDALGFKRSQMGGAAWMRNVVNQLLNEMDSATSSNEGVYILGATNHPWDLDVALRRPGRFDRMILVTLPDPEARTAILRYHLRDRPVAGIDLKSIVKRTDGFSGADLAHIATSATQLAMADSIRTGAVRPITMGDIDLALSQIKPSAGAWFESARNVVEFANADGTYDELAKYMRTKKIR